MNFQHSFVKVCNISYLLVCCSSLSGKRINGSIPEELGNITTLRELYVMLQSSVIIKQEKIKCILHLA